MPCQSTLKPVAAATLAATGISGPVLADDTIEEQTAVVPRRSIKFQHEAPTSSLQVKVLSHIADARGKLKGDSPDVDKAKSEEAQLATTIRPL